jgi:ABC-type phosphate/phosphonate transport system substrate-binding protein
MNISHRRVLHAGMYTPGDAHKAAWQAWFFELNGSYLCHHYPDTTLGFETDEQAYTSATVIAAHTCGYPYVKHWVDTHELIAAPVFDVPGCKPDKAQYSSWFIARTDHPGKSLHQFQNARVAINSEHSNSGMNVLRYAISQIYAGGHFFSERIFTGGHQQSMIAIANGAADLAAIDAVSYALICELDPDLCAALKMIGQSELTAGLPFICIKDSSVNRSELSIAMDRAVKNMRPDARKLLRLKGFKPVKKKDYDKIIQLEKAAIAADYPELY